MPREVSTKRALAIQRRDQLQAVMDRAEASTKPNWTPMQRLNVYNIEQVKLVPAEHDTTAMHTKVRK